MLPACTLFFPPSLLPPPPPQQSAAAPLKLNESEVAVAARLTVCYFLPNEPSEGAVAHQSVPKTQRRFINILLQIIITYSAERQVQRVNIHAQFGENNAAIILKSSLMFSF